MSVRAFAPQGFRAADAQELTLDREESHYLVRVRRRRAADTFELLLPEGGGHAASVLDADPKRCRVRVGPPLPARPCLPVDLAVGIVDSKAAAEVVARASEAGARSLQWLDTAHSQATAPTDQRIDRVLQASRRQCGRLRSMQVLPPLSFSAWMHRGPTGCVAAVPGPEIARAPAQARSSAAQALLVGPEGGLSPQEQDEALAGGLCPLGLGPYVLRTEVAVVAGLAVLAQRCSATPS